jgi:transcriptional regulator with XRE-family HTH domain
VVVQENHVQMEQVHPPRRNRIPETCGLGQKLFQLYESGIKDNPGLKTLQKIAQGFGVELNQLLARSTPIPNR